MNLLDVLRGADIALRLLQARLVTVLALFLTAGLYGWAMWKETTLGAILCVLWGLSIFLPVLFTGRGGHDGSVSQEAAQHPASAPDGG